MFPVINTIAINGKRRQSLAGSRETLLFIATLWERLGHPAVVMNNSYHNALLAAEAALGNNAPALPQVTLTRPGCRMHADIAVSIGGDGTFLRTARWIGSCETPILGVNAGHLGFLSDITLENSGMIIDDIVSGNMEVHSRTMLSVIVTGDTPVDDPAGVLRYPFALNEVAVLRDDTASMITVDTLLDGAPLARYRADGLIISTPTGSTGYNLSVGGPIVGPSTPAWVISPVAAHSLTMRPLVVPDTSVVALSVYSRVPAYRLSLDGRSVILPLGAGLRVSRAPFVVNILSRPGHSFAGTLRSKLLWGMGSADE